MKYKPFREEIRFVRYFKTTNICVYSA